MENKIILAGAVFLALAGIVGAYSWMMPFHLGNGSRVLSNQQQQALSDLQSGNLNAMDAKMLNAMTAQTNANNENQQLDWNDMPCSDFMRGASRGMMGGYRN